MIQLEQQDTVVSLVEVCYKPGGTTVLLDESVRNLLLEIRTIFLSKKYHCQVGFSGLWPHSRKPELAAILGLRPEEFSLSNRNFPFDEQFVQVTF